VGSTPTRPTKIMHLEIRTVGDRRDLRHLQQFLIQQSLWYPSYEEWVHDTCIPEIDLGYKTGLIAYERNRVVGDIIFQPHKNLPKTREIKNLRVDPTFKRRDLAHFLLRQVEEENKGDFERIVCDTDKRQSAVVKLLLFSGYRTIQETPLYDSNNIDIIFHKEISSRGGTGIRARLRNV
jgi:GNAT superfamily N-acetyltransferase